jgi:hypothetical protein
MYLKIIGREGILGGNQRSIVTCHQSKPRHKCMLLPASAWGIRYCGSCAGGRSWYRAYRGNARLPVGVPVRLGVAGLLGFSLGFTFRICRRSARLR